MKHFSKLMEMPMRAYDDALEEWKWNPKYVELCSGTYVAPEGWRLVSVSIDRNGQGNVYVLLESEAPVPGDHPYR